MNKHLQKWLPFWLYFCGALITQICYFMVDINFFIRCILSWTLIFGAYVIYHYIKKEKNYG